MALKLSFRVSASVGNSSDDQKKFLMMSDDNISAEYAKLFYVYLPRKDI